MSRIGKKPILIPQGVDVQISDSSVQVKGKLGALQMSLHPFVAVKSHKTDTGQSLGVEIVEAKIKEKKSKPKVAWALWGMTRSRISAMVLGVTQGYTRELELRGVGFRAALKGNALEFSLGFSHPVVVQLPEGIKAKIEKDVRISLVSADKELVGEFAARIRGIRPPDAYKGKGVRYVNEYVRQKAGKSAASSSGGSGA